MENTLAFVDDGNKWTTFYSFVPDLMLGMNNKFFSFKNGDLYRHHEGNINEFYGVTAPSKLVLVFNDSPSDDKLFKTIMLESTAAWDIALETNYTNTTIASAEFNKRESRWFAYTRKSEDDTDFASLSITGVGNILSNTLNEVSFSFVNELVNIGDKLYQIENNQAVLLGQVTVINGTSIMVDALQNPIVNGSFAFTTKNPRIESSSIRGYYMKAELTNNDNEEVEIFAVNTNAVKSYV